MSEMARNIAVVLLAGLAGLASCMEMRETVERMVMVRTTGSDLQPAATGYIYKKDNNGPASVIKMEETEIMEQLSKLYKEPESFVAPAPATGPFYEKGDGADEAASHTDEHIIPVVEKSEDEGDNVDGIADDDFPKVLKDYAADFGGYNNDFADYLHGLGHYDHDIFHGYGGGSDYGTKGHDAHGDDGYKAYANKHHYGKAGAGDYRTEKYESYSVSDEGGSKKSYGSADKYGKHYAGGKGHKGGDQGHKQAHSKGEALDGYHKVFNKDEYKKDHDAYDGEEVSGGFSKHAEGHAHRGSGAGDFEKGVTHKSGHDEAGFGKGGFHEQEHGDQHRREHSSDEDGESYHHKGAEFGVDGGKFGGKSFGFKVEH